MLLDTTFLIDLLRGDERAVERLRELEATFVRPRLSAMTLFELYYGVARSDQPDDERETVADGDVIIAATALVTDESVLTRNVTDFERVPGVAVETY